MSKCYGCGRPDLGIRRKRFDWLVGLGYSEKDAAARVLHDPKNKMLVKQCCIVGLQTNIDPDEQLRENEELRDFVIQENLRRRGESKESKREVVKFVASQINNQGIGKFILRDSGDLEDPTLLAPRFEDAAMGRKSTGFEITNVALIPKMLAATENWKDVPIALWSGKIKIIPVVQYGNELLPGIIHVIRENDPVPRPITLDDFKEYIGAEIVDYAIETIRLPAGVNQMTGESIYIDHPNHVMTVRKQVKEDIIA